MVTILGASLYITFCTGLNAAPAKPVAQQTPTVTVATPSPTVVNASTPSPTPARPTPVPGTPLPSPALPATGSGGTLMDCHVNGALPDAACTPGATLPVDAATVCVRGYSKSVRNVPTAVWLATFDRYGINSHPPGAYEVDHLISLELGGSNDPANLWPEAASPRPGFHEKDRFENYLHAQVCSGAMALADAQHAIATDWLSAWQAAGQP